MSRKLVFTAKAEKDGVGAKGAEGVHEKYDLAYLMLHEYIEEAASEESPAAKSALDAPAERGDIRTPKKAKA